MEGSVAAIFKTLIKVPIIIFISYLILNLFAFALSYFKLLGISYVVMQTTVENNYLPESERSTIESYLETLESPMLTDIEIVTLEETDDRSANKRTQYGVTKEVGVRARFQIIWPLMPKEQLVSSSDKFAGTDKRATTNFGDEDTLKARRNDSSHSVWNTIQIVYTVPGLKYYPDI